ncbi:MAG: dTDP-4-dehydrorhamnose 3,5-epimerase family protein [Parcubacteria group bacterium]|nr:dTDP-4-dehydrorhamnose 3,5-epimerase family protein [Parcubacteria group bacterium]
MIEGVIIKPLERFSDERGWLCEAWRNDESDFQPSMAYVSKTEPGAVRGPHEHKEQSDCFIFTGPGNFCMYLWENRQGRLGYRQLETMEVGEDNPCMIVVPPGVVHGYKCISKEPGYYVNLPNQLYKGEGKQDAIDEIRWEKGLDSPFKIG